mgnify:CR=1 FL=1
MTSKPSVLVVDDDNGHRLMLEALLGKWGYRVQSAANGVQAVEKVREGPFDAVLMDIRMPDMDGITALKGIKSYNPAVPVVLMTAYSAVESAVEALKSGAYDYLIKPLDFDVLKLTLSRTLEHSRLKAENSQLRAESRSRAIVGNSPSIRRMQEMIETVAPSDATVLIIGKSGTGKELVARSIHQLSSRADGPWVAVNCAALSENLLESELFGHEKGAFTGADKRREGRFLQASGGTLFLDEIGEIPLQMQVKLLRALQQREIQRVGSDETISVDVRIVAATNRDLAEEIRAGRFREDLYYRLNVVPIEIPPLRERKRDIRPLVESFLKDMNKKYRYQKRFAGAAMEILYSYVWPGNVRELKNVVEQAVILSAGDEIQPSELPIACRFEGESHGGDETGRVNLKLEVARFEYEYICRAYEKYGTVRAAAASLGMDSATFVRKRRKFEELLQK